MLGATIGIVRPTAVTWLNSDLFTIFLGFLMLSMGLTLTVEDFKKVRRCAAPAYEQLTRPIVGTSEDGVSVLSHLIMR